MIPHHIYFEVLADLKETDPEWDATLLGYLVMGLVDDWLMLGPVRIANDPRIPQLGERIAELETRQDPIAPVAKAIVEALVNAPDTAASSIAEPVLAYGALLERQGRWALAADAYATVGDALEYARNTEASDLASAAFARRRQAFCLRNTGDYEGAEANYRSALRLANSVRDERDYAFAKYGLANMARIRGNLPAAEAGLNELLRELKSYSPEVRRAVEQDILHTLGAVKHDRGHYTDAIVDLYQALLMSDPSTREFILVDLGNTACAAGLRKIARDAYGIVMLTAHSSHTRQVAIVNLIEIAALDHNQEEFEHLRSEWRPEQCDAMFNSYARLHIARGLERFATRDEALHAYQEAVDFSQRMGIHKVQFEALHDLERLETAPKDTPPPPDRELVHPPTSIVSISEALSEMHDIALRSGSDGLS